MGDHWEEYKVFHHKFETWLEVNGHNVEDVKNMPDAEVDKLVESSPYHKATANDIDWLQKVKMQGQVQKWVDHSISVTVNLPEEATEELVGNVYLEGWKHGCKGITVYREGSRDGVLISNTKAKAPEPVEHTKRPKELDAEIVRFQNNREKWIAFVGIRDGIPYEIFTGLADEEMFPIPKTITKGKIIKHRDPGGKSRYDFQFTDRFGYRKNLEGLSHMFNKEYWNYAKLISSVLRHGMPLEYAVNLVSSLKFGDENINSWKVGVERALKKYIPDGTKAKAGLKCSRCESVNQVYQEGCLICTDCGHSKCG